MNRTRILVVLLVLVVLIQIFPERAGVIEMVAISGGGLYFLAWAGLRFLAQYKQRRAEDALSVADEAEYQEYRRELDAIRAVHDPVRDLDDPTSISPEYQQALTALHDKHEGMLTRKFGPRS